MRVPLHCKARNLHTSVDRKDTLASLRQDTWTKLSYESFEAKDSPGDFPSFISTLFCDYQEERDICLIIKL